MTTAIESTVAALWNALDDTPTTWKGWHLWRMLSDAYGDLGHEIEQGFCLWVATKERYPSDKLKRDHMALDWFHFNDGHLDRCASIPITPASAENYDRLDLAKDWYRGSPTYRRAYQYLLEFWHALSDQQRQEWFAWEPS